MTYRVYWISKDGDSNDDYLIASSAQEAADIARNVYEAEEIIEIARVVKNWK